MKSKKKLICSVCKTEPHSDDAGYGIPFKKGDPILCKQKRSRYHGKYHLHYHDESQLEDAIVDTANGYNDDDRAVRSMTCKEGKVLAI